MKVLAAWWRAMLALPRQLRRLGRMTPARQRLMLEAWAALVRARAWMALRRFEQIAPRLGRAAAAGEADTVVPLSGADEHAAREVSMAVLFVARYVPFRAVCLQQAVAARLMLRRRGIPSTLYFGVARRVEQGAPRLAAHAWLRAGQVEVTGYDIRAEYREIARYC